jgi:hypothetical protein
MSQVRSVTYVSGIDKDGIGAPRPMKMGTIASPWCYDAAACHALQSASLRPPAISRCASSAAVFPAPRDGSGYCSMPPLSLNPRIDVMCQKQIACLAATLTTAA